MIGRRPLTPVTAAACIALALVVSACSRDGATTGPTQGSGKDFAANLRLVSGDQQLGAVALPLSLPIVVKVVDAGGQPVQGAAVAFGVRAGGGSINPAANVSDASGLVTSTWTLGTTLGANKAVAILTNNFLLDSTTFTATANPGGPKTITITGGNAQSSNAGRLLGIPLAIKVVDNYGYAVSGRKVTWQPGNLSGSAAFLVDTTSADGSASATWQLGVTAVGQSMNASVAGVTLPVTFTATVAPDTGRVLSITAGGGQTGSSGAALATQLKLTLTDQYGNPIVNDGVTWTDSIAGGGSVNPQTNATNALGQASATWTLGGNAGPQFLRAKNGNAKVNFTATGTLAYGDVIAGNAQACAVAVANQRAYCWGTGDAGQLGKGVNKNIPAPSTPVSTSSDSVVGPFLSVRLMAGGRNSFCALSVARQVFCWGRVVGQAAVTNNVATLATIVDPRQQILPNWIALGEEHYCLLDLAGLGSCTGTDFSGQLGDGTFLSPTVGTYPFIAPAGGPQRYSIVSAGKQHTCGFRQYNPGLGANNLVPECWGLNATGQVGNATTTFTSINTPVFVNLPVGAPTAFDTTSLTLGGQHTCVLSQTGAGWCWGSNGFGQLGKAAGFTAVSRDSVMQAVGGGIPFTKIYAGEYHTCALSTAGAAYCWGRNDYGELGNGTTTTSGLPVAVAGGLVFRSLSVGEFFTCGVANAGIGAPPGSPAISAGTVYCWGDNSFGQIGQNTTGNAVPFKTPKKVLYQP